MAAQKKAGQPPRTLLPVYVADEPIYLCSFCDGDAYTMARAVEADLASE